MGKGNFNDQSLPIPEVSALKESVRHNEKGIDRVERRVDKLETELKDFRAEVSAKFDKVDAKSNDLESGFQTRLIIGVAVIVIANVVIKYLP
ncbi:hypothetical protein [Acaryochloris sp. IP29b_bin.148]|uniref:hypothetical protein n=1 Tax=Acaryochloris sp. IP29b_bin.148 TaxID=2969218 RepID=UPI00260ADF1C|nr:hypothetical protein [Acaryochloris sp. IP29b_bin.148]